VVHCQRIRRGEPPGLYDLAISAAGLLQRDWDDRRPPTGVSLRAWVTGKSEVAEDTVAELDQLRQENEQLRLLLDSTVRAFRLLDAELNARRQVPMVAASPPPRRRPCRPPQLDARLYADMARRQRRRRSVDNGGESPLDMIRRLKRQNFPGTGGTIEGILPQVI
jgi:hypothetical protein